MTQSTSIQAARPGATQSAADARTAGSSASAAPAPGGFALLLAALGQEALPDGALPGAVAEGGREPGASLAAPQGALAAMPAAPDGAVVAMPPALDAGQPQDDRQDPAGQEGAPAAALDPATLAMLLAGQGLPGDAGVQPAPASAPGLPDAALARSPGDSAQAPLTAAAADAGAAGHWLPSGLVAETGRIDTAAGAAEGAAVQPAAPVRPGAARASRPAAPAAALAGAWRPAGGNPAGVAAAAAGAPPGAASASEAPAQPRLQPEALLPGERSAALHERLRGGEALAAPPYGPAQSIEATAPLAGMARASGRSEALEPHPGAAQAEGALREPSEIGAAPAADAAGQGGADAGDAQAQLAERVAWWVHQQTHSAALTLDQGGQPVQVQVTLTGDQAHVTFRSDEAQARQLLDAGTAELRALLDAQGLQLAGVTVGQSGDAPGQGRQEQTRDGVPVRQGQARVQAGDAAVPAVRVQRTGGVGERSVDVFV